MKMSISHKDKMGYDSNVHMMSPVPSQTSDTPMLSPQFSLQGSPMQVQTANQGCLILHYAPAVTAQKQQNPRLQPIMPNTLQQSKMMRCKRRLDFSNFGYELPKPETGTVGRRNERERNRVKLINMTFATLRACIPARNRGQKSRKMSKVDTLKAAIDYIQDLQEILDEHDNTAKSANSTYNDAQNAMHMNSNVYAAPEEKFNTATAMQSQAFYPAFRNDNCFTTTSNTAYSAQKPNSIINNNNTNNFNNNLKTCNNNVFQFDIQNSISHRPLQSTDQQTSQHVTGYPYTPALSPGSSGTVTNSPQPSLTSSDGSGNISPDEEDLLDFTSWFN